MPYGYGGGFAAGGYGGGVVAGGYSGGFLNPYVMIIVILIVLQWFRVGSGGVGGVGVGPEPGLLNNGGLFIIAIFLLAFCACGRGLSY